MSMIESRNSLVAVYAAPAGAIARETKLTANKVLASGIPFWRVSVLVTDSFLIVPANNVNQ